MINIYDTICNIEPFSIEKKKNFYIIRTPFLTENFDLISFLVFIEKDKVILSDDSDIANELSIKGIDITNLSRTRWAKYGVKFNNDSSELITDVYNLVKIENMSEQEKIEWFNKRIFDFIQCLQDLVKTKNDKYFLMNVLKNKYGNNFGKMLKRFYRDYIINSNIFIQEYNGLDYFKERIAHLILFDLTELKRNLEIEITNFNGTFSCCADESGTIIEGLISWIVNNENISLQETYSDAWGHLNESEQERLFDWKNDKELTYWSCKKWKDTKEVVEWIKEKYDL